MRSATHYGCRCAAVSISTGVFKQINIDMNNDCYLAGNETSNVILRYSQKYPDMLPSHTISDQWLGNSPTSILMDAAALPHASINPMNVTAGEFAL